MKILFRSFPISWEQVSEEFATTSAKKELEKTRFALDMAYAGFNDAVNPDLIDSYIYEINSLQKKYKYLSELAAKEENTKGLFFPTQLDRAQHFVIVLIHIVHMKGIMGFVDQ